MNDAQPTRREVCLLPSNGTGKARCVCNNGKLCNKLMKQFAKLAKDIRGSQKKTPFGNRTVKVEVTKRWCA
jgi:hypothetical protein